MTRESTQYATGQAGWVELTQIRCDGSGSVLEIGDVMLPEHGLGIATGYDDAYNQTPERVLRQIQALGLSRRHPALCRDEPLYAARAQ
jgi:hypothetical protein